MKPRKLIVIERLERPTDERTHAVSVYDMERAPRPSEWPLRASKTCTHSEALLAVANAMIEFDVTLVRYET